MTEFEEQALALLVEIRDLLTPKALPLPAPVAPVMAVTPVGPEVVAVVAEGGLAG